MYVPPGMLYHILIEPSEDIVMDILRLMTELPSFDAGATKTMPIPECGPRANGMRFNHLCPLINARECLLRCFEYPAYLQIRLSIVISLY